MPAVELGTTKANKLQQVSGTKIRQERERRSEGQLKARVIAMWAKDSDYAEIVEQVNSDFGLTGPFAITTNTVARYIHKQLEYWRDRCASTVDEKMALTLMRFNQIEEMASQAFFDSKKGKVTTNFLKKINTVKSQKHEDKIAAVMALEKAGTSSMLGDDLLKDAIQVTAEEIRNSTSRDADGPGDPRFLTIMMQANKERAQLWNLYKRTDAVSGDQEFARMSDDQRTERLVAIISAAKNRTVGLDATNLAPAAPLGGFAEGKEPSPAERGEVDIDDFDWD